METRKPVMFKALVVAVAFLCVLPVNAGENIRSREIAQGMIEAFAAGYVDAEIRSSCLIQTTADNREYVVNEIECLESLTELESVLSEIDGQEEQLNQVRRFRSQQGI
jgi:hypothetical protein